MSLSDLSMHDSIARSRLFDRVARFVVERTTVPALRDAALDKPLRVLLWSPHWALLRAASEHDAALFMCFLLACAALRIDVARAVDAIRASTRPGRSMKQFLAERGLLAESAFDALARRVDADEELP
ncbi:MAG: hypothetical protein ACTHL8_16485 [Burkholderiaceae bacterium]